MNGIDIINRMLQKYPRTTLAWWGASVIPSRQVGHASQRVQKPSQKMIVGTLRAHC